MSHTPGPWKEYGAYVVNDQDFQVCMTGIDANRRLIAAAPELLEALEAMYALHTGEHGEDDHARARSKALTKAELAIDKALGK